MESLDLTYDTLFKIYFKSKECFNYLISIVSELLKIDKEYVRENLKILDSEIITENANKEKKKMTDCIVSIDNIIIVFEMNRNYYKKIKENKLKYLCAIFASKKYWDEEKNLILFNINAYKSKLDKPKKFSSYVLKNKSNDIYTQTIKVYEMYLEYENKKYKEGKRLKKIEKYLLYLLMTRYDKKEINEFIKGDEVLMEAEKIRDDLIKRETIRFYYDQELDEMIEKKSIREDALEEGMEKGVKKGLKIEKRNIAKNLLNLGMPIDTIIKATGLSKKEISKM